MLKPKRLDWCLLGVRIVTVMFSELVVQSFPSPIICMLWKSNIESNGNCQFRGIAAYRTIYIVSYRTNMIPMTEATDDPTLLQPGLLFILLFNPLSQNILLNLSSRGLRQLLNHFHPLGSRESG